MGAGGSCRDMVPFRDRGDSEMHSSVMTYQFGTEFISDSLTVDMVNS